MFWATLFGLCGQTCRVTTRRLNAQSARNRRFFSPGLPAAVSTSKTHLATRISHLSARHYPRNACRISKSICRYDRYNSKGTRRRYIVSFAIAQLHARLALDSNCKYKCGKSISHLLHFNYLRVSAWQSFPIEPLVD